MLKTRAGAIRGTRPADPNLDDGDVLYTRREAAEYLRKSVPTLERWARQGIGPRVVRVGPRSVAYTLASLREHVVSR